MDDDDEMEETFGEGVFLGCEIDLDYEFDAPRYFDFGRAETPAEARAAELWFDTAGSYPPSRLALCCMLHGVSKVSGKSITKGPFSKGSTLMKPTASQLAKQNQPHEVKNACRYRKPAAVKSNRNFEDSSSYLHQAAKRQRLERGHLCKIVGARPQPDLIHKVPKKKTGPAICTTGLPRLKLTIPKEPELETARRALNFRAQGVSDDKKAKDSRNMSCIFKARPLNKKEFNLSTTKRCQQTTLTELFNMLSLASEEQQTTSQTRFQLPTRGAAKDMKENSSTPLQK